MWRLTRLVLASLEDDATGLVTIQKSNPGGSAAESASTERSAASSALASASEPTGASSASLPGSTGTPVLTQTTNAAPRATGAVARELLFGAAGAIGAGIFGL